MKKVIVAIVALSAVIQFGQMYYELWQDNVALSDALAHAANGRPVGMDGAVMTCTMRRMMR